MPEIAAVPLSYYNVEEDSYYYKLAVLVRFLQNHALLVREKPEIISANVLNYYNNNMKEIKNKILYLLKDELASGIQTTEDIKKVYPHPFEIVDIEDIEEAIEKKDPNVVFLHKVGPEGTKLNARSYKIIMGAADASLFYFDYHKISTKNPDGLLQTDLKKLSK